MKTTVTISFFIFALAMFIIMLSYPNGTEDIIVSRLLVISFFAVLLVPFCYFVMKFYKVSIGKKILWVLPLVGAISALLPFIIIDSTYSMGINACQNSRSHCGAEMIIAPFFIIISALMGLVIAYFIYRKHKSIQATNY